MTGTIILAAGGSSRLGQAKQLLTFRDKSLMKHVASEAIQSETGPVVVVTGANAALVAAELTDVDVLIGINEEWETGMASSIRKGLTVMLEAFADIDAVVLAVCDQPFVSASLFCQLQIKQEKTGKRIVACAYDGIFGTPVLFDKKYFWLLASLQGQQGAKKLIALHPEDVETIPFAGGEIDIDTADDYKSLQQQS
jgi:molybdenum cofactor cytidylyltransferase